MFTIWENYTELGLLHESYISFYLNSFLHVTRQQRRLNLMIFQLILHSQKFLRI